MFKFIDKHLKLILTLSILVLIGVSGLAISKYLNKSSNNSNLSGIEDAKPVTGPLILPVSFRIASTGQAACYNNTIKIDCPKEGEAFYGQDYQFETSPLLYTDNNDGTVSDAVTGLMWQKDAGDKMTYAQAVALNGKLELAGYSDWRLPTIKELYSLINFSGTDVNPMSTSTANLQPYIDNKAFVFNYGNPSKGERIIDSQWVTTTTYVDKVMNGQACFFGVNFADGRIKCYPTTNQNYYARFVRGGSDYGVNKFADNKDGTVTDSATGLMWQQADNGKGVLWAEGLKICQDLSLGGHNDWRMPNAKELGSIVDYTRSPMTTDSPAIDPVFQSTSITNEAGSKDWPFYWSSTTHLAYPSNANEAVYFAFGKGMGNFNGNGWIDVHGAGSQRSDPKDGVPSSQVNGQGPQGDARRSENFVRCVRNSN